MNAARSEITLAQFEAFLKEAMGLDTPSIGTASIERALQERMTATAIAHLSTYWQHLNDSSAEQQQLIEAVVVPETWFFRDIGAFTALASHAKQSLTARPKGKPLRILSAPCSTGEEPYSIAMTLLDAGLDPLHFEIDAIDISERAIEHARRAVYGRNSFRSSEGTTARANYFDANRVCDHVRDRVRFHHSNLFDLESRLPPADRYDAIFCRNLLIYFDRPTQDQAVKVLSLLLAKTGVLFVGPSETGLLLSHTFEPTGWPMSFAFRAPDTKRAPISVPAQTLSASPAKSVAKRAADRSPRRPRREAKTSRRSDQPPASLDNALAQAEALANRGDITAAREHCESFIRTSGPTAQALYLMGLLEDAAGQTARAIDHYRGAIYLDPTHEQALVHLATLINQQGDHATAQRLLARAKRVATQGVES